MGAKNLLSALFPTAAKSAISTEVMVCRPSPWPRNPALPIGPRDIREEHDLTEPRRIAGQQPIIRGERTGPDARSSRELNGQYPSQAMAQQMI
jgi:hypothetical protein